MPSHNNSAISGITAVVCTYNGAERLEEVLGALEAQSFVSGASVFVIVVDNNSTDDTYLKANTLAAESAIPIEVHRETRQGKRFALELAMSKVRTNYTAIIDDDNVVPSDYCKRVYERFELDADIGFIGVATELLSDCAPPSWWSREASNYAVGRQAPRSGYLDELGKYSVWGAGMAFRTKIWNQAYSHYISKLAGRNAVNLVAGEDSELCLLAVLLGYRGYVENDLVVGHRMPPGRLTEAYLIRLCWSLGCGVIENQILLDEWIVRSGKLNILTFALRRTPKFSRLYYWLRIRFLGCKSLIVPESEKVHVEARKAAYRGCLDAVSSKSASDLWSFPYGHSVKKH